MVVNTIKGVMSCALPYLEFLAQINHLLTWLNFQLRHVYRELNFVADGLHNKAVQDCVSSVFGLNNQLTAAINFKVLQDERCLTVLRSKTVFVVDDGG